MRKARLSNVELPDFGMPVVEPELSADLYRQRLSRLEARMAKAGYGALIVYGDREHAANIAWLTGYDPRFEEALCLVVPGRKPALLVGNEGLGYAGIARGVFDIVLWQPLSLMGQPRDRYRPLKELMAEAGIAGGMRVGIAGWKGFESEDGQFDPDWFETPAYLAEAARSFGDAENAALIFMNPADWLRAINEIDLLACFECMATRTSAAIRGLIHGLRPGMSEYDAARLLQLDGSPHSVHPMLAAGPRARVGLASPSTRPIGRGEPITCALGLMGALNCRAGFVASDASDLSPAIADYVERLVAPYFVAVAAWYETIGIGVPGGRIHETVMSRLGDSFFGIGLNPGHLIHLDEWLHSPIRKGSTVPLRSGMAIQCDIIPATGTDYFTTNIEDGVALLDEEGRAAFAARYPEAWSRIVRRRSFMTDVLGIGLRPEVLPFSNLAAWLPPLAEPSHGHDHGVITNAGAPVTAGVLSFEDR